MKQDYFVSGQWNLICDVCGRKFKIMDMRKRWDGLMVCRKDFETRHPLDFIKIPAEKNNVEDARPEAPDQFIPVNFGVYNQRIMGNLFNNCKIG